jgi:hypothetical protein
MTDYTRQLGIIAACEAPKKLRSMLAQAKASGIDVLEKAAFARLIELDPAEEPGSLEHDFVTSADAFERALTEAAGHSVKISPLRQKAAREGVSQVVLEQVQAADISDDTRARLDHGLPELTAEALVLRHPSRFGADTRNAARTRLVDAGVNMRDLPGS